MIKIGFYFLGMKGYECLVSYVEEFGSDGLRFVCSSRDAALQHDFYDEISSFCSNNRIPFFERNYQKVPETDVDIAVGWRWIIKDSKKLIVFHDSLLPRYRGFSPLVNMLINNEPVIGVTALLAVNEYDAGDIISQASIEVDYPIKIKDAIEKISKLYSGLLIDVSRKLMAGNALEAAPQCDLEATYSLWRNEDDYSIDWSDDSKNIARFIDAVGYPYSGAKTKVNGLKVRVMDVEVVKDVAIEDRRSHIGKVIFMESGVPIVVCGSGLLKIKEIQEEGNKPLSRKLPFRSRFGDY